MPSQEGAPHPMWQFSVVSFQRRNEGQMLTKVCHFPKVQRHAFSICFTTYFGPLDIAPTLPWDEFKASSGPALAPCDD